MVKGLPVKDKQCTGIYCSHVLEHLSLEDFRNTLKNSYNLLKEGGIFKCVLPDLEYVARTYINNIDSSKESASIDFFYDTQPGQEKRAKGVLGIMKTVFGNSKHLWMWNVKSLATEFSNIGFKDIHACKFNDC